MAVDALVALYAQNATRAGATEALDVAWAGLFRLAGGGDPHAIARAHAAIAGPPAARKKIHVLALVESAARGWGVPERPAKASAALLARFLGRPQAIVPELARRLEAHYVPQKQGRIPKGRFTTAQIADWLAGDPEIARIAPWRSSRGRK
jgi:hypothetical protein